MISLKIKLNINGKKDLLFLLSLKKPEDCKALYAEAFLRTTNFLQNKTYWRALIELSNVCVYDCNYCGIRKSNHALCRYSLTTPQIIEVARHAFQNGYTALALQSGERDDEKFIGAIEELLHVLHKESQAFGIKNGVGLTLSFGEQTQETYCRWKEAAGNKKALRYLLRLETSNATLFKRLHNGTGRQKTLAERVRALTRLRQAGYQVGTGIMVGIPGQTLNDIVNDMRLFEKIDPDMFGLGPYLVSQGGTMVHEGMMNKKELLTLTLNTIAVLRLLFPTCNIAAATALETLTKGGRLLGVNAGCNVLMPNFSPSPIQTFYRLYDNKEKTEATKDDFFLLEREIAEGSGRQIAKKDFGSSLRFQKRLTA